MHTFINDPHNAEITYINFVLTTKRLLVDKNFLKTWNLWHLAWLKKIGLKLWKWVKYVRCVSLAFLRICKKEIDFFFSRSTHHPSRCFSIFFVLKKEQFKSRWTLKTQEIIQTWKNRRKISLINTFCSFSMRFISEIFLSLLLFHANAQKKVIKM